MNIPSTTLKSRRAALICNTTSRQGRDQFEHACRLLGERGIEVVASHPVEDGAQLPGLVEAAVAEGLPLVIVGGGDGTMAGVSRFFAHRETVLGVLPLGTGNSFARSMHLPLDIEGAVEVIAAGKVATVDLGMVNGRHFVNQASIGLSADVAHDTPGPLKRVLGPLAYLVTGAGETMTHEPFCATLTTPERELRVETHQIVIANGGVFGTTQIAPGASSGDGVLHVYTMKGRDRSQIAKMWGAFLAGTPTELNDAEYFTARDVQVTTGTPLQIDVDGELVETTPGRFSVDRQALRMMVAPAYEDALR